MSLSYSLELIAKACFTIRTVPLLQISRFSSSFLYWQEPIEKRTFRIHTRPPPKNARVLLPVVAPSPSPFERLLPCKASELQLHYLRGRNLGMGHSEMRPIWERFYDKILQYRGRGGRGFSSPRESLPKAMRHPKHVVFYESPLKCFIKRLVHQSKCPLTCFFSLFFQRLRTLIGWVFRVLLVLLYLLLASSSQYLQQTGKAQRNTKTYYSSSTLLLLYLKSHKQDGASTT